MLLAALACGACGGGIPRPELPLEATAFALSEHTLEAFRAEANDDTTGAVRRYLGVLDDARLGDRPWHVAAARAAIDALVMREIPSLREVTTRTALAFRAPRTSQSAPELEIEQALATMHANTASAVVKGEIARGLVALAERRGDWTSAERYRAARGCARQLTVIGPVDWTSLSGLHTPSPLDAWNAPVPASTRTPGPFGRAAPPSVVDERGCDVDVMSATAETGVRDVLVDVVVPRAQVIAVELRAASAAELRVGGELALVRPYELGDAAVAAIARAEVGEGRVRIVVHVAGEEHDATLGISVWNDEGDPMTLIAPRPGERATARASRAVAVTLAPRPQAPPSERLTLALGALASGDARSAERLLAGFATRERPELGLAYARSLDGALDLPTIQRAERARSAVQTILEVAPKWWEPSLMSAQLAAVRRGEGEAPIEALRDLDARKAAGASSPMLDAFECAWASNVGLVDRASTALARFAAKVGESTLTAELREASTRAPMAARAKVRCGGNPNLDRSELSCYGALRDLGDHEGAKRELARLRQLAGASRLFGPLAVRDGIGTGDLADARAEYQRLLPGERWAGAEFVLAPPASFDVTKDRLVATVLRSREAPQALAGLLTAAGDDRLRPFEGVAEKVVALDRAHPAMPGAATVVLTHTERYVVDAAGLVSVVVHDVRRVGGTTDVEQNAQADAPLLLGRSSLRAVVRRILKPDGRILLPDRTPGAAQSHADLSQLGPGDVVEALYEGFALPSETYDIGFDTPDLLPDRTAVVSASIEIALPKRLEVSMRAHPLLGDPAKRDDGAMRVLTWTLKDKPARRFEEGVPKMDRSVGVSLTTASWTQVARALGETIRALDERDPEVAAWAHTAAGDARPSLELLTRVVAAAGEALRQPAAGLFADFGVGRAGPQQTMNARTFLAEREGSRTWLIARALRELGVPSEIVVAEREPYSMHSDFPARFGRFVHPLVIARVPDSEHAGKTVDLFIDADVPGPPLPPGRVSPELRGRKILHTDGTITQLPAGNGSERDEIDLRLALDARGDARGSFTAVLRGRAAQELADAFTRIVGDERMRALRNVVLGYVPAANVDSVVLSSSEGSWQIALRADITISGFAQPEKNKKGEITWVVPGVDPVHYVFPRPFVTTVTSAYASQGARQNALAVGSALQYHLRRRVDLPKGSRIVRAPGPLRVDAGLLQGERTVAGGAQAIEDDFVLGVRTGTVAQAGYSAFVDAARRIDEGFLASTRIAMP
jgi:hypothetical protein